MIAVDEVAVPAPRRPVSDDPAGGREPVGERCRPDLPRRVRLVVGATFAGEPVEVVVTDGLVEILHAGVLVATHAQRLKPDQADRIARPRLPVQRRARDATVGLTVTRLRRRFRNDQLRWGAVSGRPALRPAAGRGVHRRRVGAAGQGRQSDPRASDPSRPLPGTRRLRQPEGTPPTQDRRITIMSGRNRSANVARVPEIDNSAWPSSSTQCTSTCVSVHRFAVPGHHSSPSGRTSRITTGILPIGRCGMCGGCSTLSTGLATHPVSNRCSLGGSVRLPVLRAPDHRPRLALSAVLPRVPGRCTTTLERRTGMHPLRAREVR